MACNTTKETSVKEETPVVEEPVIQETSSKNDEYERSKGDLDISKDTFEEDKREILHIIRELDAVMSEQNYNAWVSYVDSDSVEYWSKKSNLQKASQRLPVKGLRLNSLNDYFKYVFIPSRKGRNVDEIRYETEAQVKAVQVEDEIDTVYYNFIKHDGKWRVHLPELSD